MQAKNITEARNELAKFEAEILTDQYVRPEKMMLRDLYEREWLTKYAPEKYSHKSLHLYISIIEDRVLPTFGRMKLSDIKTIHVVNFIDDLKKDGKRLDGKEGGISPYTIQNIHQGLSSLFICAQKFGLIKDNPASGVSLPSTAGRKIKLDYSLEMVWEMIEAIKHEPYEKQVIFWIAFVTSARSSEIAALEDKHILSDENAIRFEQSLHQIVGGGFGVKSIKNNIEGTTAIPQELTTMIEKLLHEKRKDKIKMGNKWAYDDKIFLLANEYGEPFRPESISNWWLRFIKRHNLKKIRFHDLRHLSITFLIGKNVPMKSISERARHSNISTTMDVYGHNIVDVDRLAADHFSEFFDQKKAGE
ncbi:tyrosine-type recombinase/integrase [Salicibibacter halophilus]|uniref:tyrosine-type recombinase/integrase n=1 Tax=Salicibibacter halophilus TaxID=2502791 RepID=UPI001D038DC3|nr:site-specific integrase [Salicibibacter halophilus]